MLLRAQVILKLVLKLVQKLGLQLGMWEVESTEEQGASDPDLKAS